MPTAITLRAALEPIDRLRAIVDDADGKVEPRRRYLSKYLILDWREQLTETSPERQAALRTASVQWLRDIREMHEAGMDVLAGSDVAVLNVYPGSSLHDELVLLVHEIGMTPDQALERATIRSARFLRIDNSVGSVERGKTADLVLLDADPQLDVSNVRRIAGVVLRGQFHDAASLEKIRAEVLAARDLRTDDWGRPHRSHR